MFAVLTCIFVQHDLRLVAVAAIICVVASGTAFVFHGRAMRASGGLGRAWLALTGLVAGSGVWATHFMAMLAYQPSLQIGYDLPLTAASLVAAVIGMGSGFALAARRGRDRALVGGALTGCSVAVMHYMGIAAIRTQAHLTWDLRYVAASIVIGALGGMAAFSARDRVKGRWAWAPPAGLLVLGIVGLHFTAMTAISLLPDSTLAVPAEVMNRDGLAVATVALTGMILAAAASLMSMERLGHNNTMTSLRRALDAVPGGLALYDSAERLRVWNEPFARLMESCGASVAVGASRRGLIEAAARSGWFAEADDEPAAVVDELEARVRPGLSEWRIPDGRWIRHQAFRAADGGAVTMLTDVTEQKESAVAMAAARDAAEAANRAKSAFLANMSHEIRTPLNGVLGIAEVLQRTELTADQRELMGVIQQSGGRLNELLSDLLDLAKIDAGMAELRPEPVELDEIAQAMRKLFADRAAEKGLAFEVNVGPGAEAEVACDPLRLRQILTNLIGNAIKFTEAGEVVLSIARNGDLLRFEVRDTGPGLDGDSSALFERFRQADSSATRKHGGVGLGLPICNEYVRMMGGELTCESAPGRGAAFSFEVELPALVPIARPAWAATEEASHLDRFNVLVVDDNPVNRQVMELILGSVGIAHASVEDGLQAVEAMMSGGFDAVLMDIQMPVMDGLEATRRIRAWEREADRPRAPILIVSANCLKEHVDAGRAAGADAHLNKPISAGELLTALEVQMSAVRARAAA